MLEESTVKAKSLISNGLTILIKRGPNDGLEFQPCALIELAGHKSVLYKENLKPQQCWEANPNSFFILSKQALKQLPAEKHWLSVNTNLGIVSHLALLQLPKFG